MGRRRDNTYDFILFHIDSGPHSLFERILFRFSQQGVKALRKGAAAQSTQVPPEIEGALRAFDYTQWELMLAEVRSDTFRFVKTFWRRRVAESFWWVVLGYDQHLMSISRSTLKDRRNTNATIMRSGPLFDSVERVNRKLMDDELPIEEPTRLPQLPSKDAGIGRASSREGFRGTTPAFFSASTRTKHCR